MLSQLRRITLSALIPLGFASVATAEVHIIRFCCDGSQENPPVATPGHALVTVAVDDVANTVVLSGDFQGLVQPATVAHIHGPAGFGQNAGVLITLTVTGGTSGTLFVDTTTTPTNINRILNGNTYVNLHSGFAPGGELRGQIVNGIGSSFCSTSPNSAGAGALISAEGCRVASEQLVTLKATGLPADVYGLFYFGPNQIQAPFGDGFRCVGGGTRRIQPPVQADGTGAAERMLNFGAPYGAGLTSGASQNFQLWYRDGMAMMSGFNLSDGVSIDFL